MTVPSLTRKHRPQILSQALIGCLVAGALGLPTAGYSQAPATLELSAKPASTATPAADYRILHSSTDRKIVVLPNGLIVIAQELKTAPVVSCQVWVKTGSIYEQEHVGAGLSHFLEHLLSGGTTDKRTEAESNAILGQIGANVNAATGLDTVRYYINVTRDHAPVAIDLLSDWMLNSKITQDEYLRERDVIQREFEMGAGEPGRIFWKLTQMNRYKNHPARHPTIGYLDEFLKITREEIQAFYKRMYVPNNMLFVVVGDIDSQKTVDQIATLWKNAKPAPLPQISLPTKDTADGPVTASDTADIDKPRLRLAWPGTKLAAPNDYALDLLSTILGQGESSRLVKTVRDKQRLVNSVSAYNLSFSWGEGFFAVDTVLAPKPDQTTEQAVAAAKDAILAQIKLISDQGVTTAELDRAKRQVIAQAAYEGQSVEAVANRLASDMIGTSNPDYMYDYASKVQSLTAKEIQDAARAILVPQTMLTLTLLPAPKQEKQLEKFRPEDEPKQPDASAVPIDLDNSVIVRRFFEDGNAKKTTPHSIQILEPALFTLSNGLRLVVQKSTLVPAVSIHYYTLGGLLSDAPEKQGVASAGMTLLTKGTTTRTAQQISETLENLGASIDAQAGYNSTFLQATCLSQDFKSVSSLLADVILNPSFPQDQWALVQPRLVSAIKSQNDSWNGELRTHFRKMYYGDFILSQTPIGRAPVIESLTVEQIKSFYKERLGAKDSVLVVVGDVDPEAVVKLAEELFKDLPKAAAKPFIKPQQPDPVSRIEAFITAKPLAAVQVGFGPGVDRSNPDFASIQVLTRVLSSFPVGWLDQELRGKGPGLVYVVGAGSVTGLLPGYFAMLFNTKAESVPEALSRSMQVIQRAKTQPVSEEDLARAKTGVLVDEFFAKQTNNSRAMEFGLSVLYGMALDEQTQFLNQIKAVTSQDLQRVAQKYLVNPVGTVIADKPIPAEQLKLAFEGKPVAAPAEDKK